MSSTKSTKTKTVFSPKPPVSGPLAVLEAKLYEWFVAKAPFHLPKDFKEFVVKYGPWATLVIGILLLPLILAALGASILVGSVATAYGVDRIGLFYWLAIVMLVVQIAVMFYSVPKLLARERFGWQLIFYASVANIAYSVLNGAATGLASFVVSITLGLVPALAGLYVIFQIREYYTK